MIVECPHVGIRELSEAWGVSTRTVKEWLAGAGITTVQKIVRQMKKETEIVEMRQSR